MSILDRICPPEEQYYIVVQDWDRNGRHDVTTRRPWIGEGAKRHGRGLGRLGWHAFETIDGTGRKVYGELLL